MNSVLNTTRAKQIISSLVAATNEDDHDMIFEFLDGINELHHTRRDGVLEIIEASQREMFHQSMAADKCFLDWKSQMLRGGQ